MPVSIVTWRARVGVFNSSTLISSNTLALNPGILVLLMFLYLILLMICCLSRFVHSMFFVISTYMRKRTIVPFVDMLSLCSLLTLVVRLLIMAGDIELNPGPNMCGKLSFGVWNLNSLLARDGSKIHLIESLQSCSEFDIFGICESWLNDDVDTRRIEIKGFSPEPFRSDCSEANVHPRGGVCLYYKENLPIVERKDLTKLSECIVTEIKLKSKKIFFVLLYRSPNQSTNELNLFMENLEYMIHNLNKENPTAIILSGDFNARSPLLWDDEIMENLAGKKISDFINLNSLEQLINEPTHLPRDDIATCIDLVLTNNKFAFVDSGVIPSIDSRCKPPNCPG